MAGLDTLDVGGDVQGEIEDPPPERGLLPRDFVVVTGEEIDQEFEVGRIFLHPEQTETAAVIAVAEIEGKLLIAVPQSVWHRTTARRRLPVGAFAKPVLVSLGACADTDRFTVLPEGQQVKVWIGFASSSLESELEFPAEALADVNFGQGDAGMLLPYAQALEQVAKDQFGFFSAESGGAEKDATTKRLEQLETTLGDIQSSLAVLLREKDQKPAPAGAKPKGSAKKAATVKAPSLQKVAGLDDGVVQAALQAGVPMAHLQEMAGIMKDKPKRLSDVPRQVRQLSDVEAEDEVEDEAIVAEEDEEDEDPSGDSGVAKAIVQLTRICSQLSENKVKKNDALENLLDGAGSASTGESSTVPGPRRNAAALRALQKCLKDDPQKIYSAVEAQLASDFSSQIVMPGEPLTPGLSARGWLTSRSRLAHFQNHIRWTWQVAGIWDALMKDRPQEARARCALLVGAADQASIDGGSWLLGNIAMLEPAPPYHLFGQRSQITNQDLQHTALFDPRWVEVFLGHVKEVDAYQEAKEKLSKAGQNISAGGGSKDEDGNPQPRGKGGGEENQKPSRKPKQEPPTLLQAMPPRAAMPIR